MLYCSERANTHIEHGAKGAYREIRSYNRYLQPTGIIKRMHTAGSVPDKPPAATSKPQINFIY